jgi:uncharacterized membrane protein
MLDSQFMEFSLLHITLAFSYTYLLPADIALFTCSLWTLYTYIMQRPS